MVKESQTRFVSPKAWNRIEQWSRRKPVFALMGEFSAGKSTLMNFLLRKQALPTQVTATQLPPIWFSWGNKSAYIKRHDGSTQDITLDQLEQVGVNDAQFVRIFLEADILEAVDLIDTPGISDPKISTDVWRRAVGQANGVLWCTHATQAWRETERATWVALPERLQHKSLLLITRADALGQKDRQKVLRRVNREAGHLFNRTILFSARDAIMARDKTGDAELWARSGGGKMVDSFLEITEQIMDGRADQLARYQIDKSMSDEPASAIARPVSDGLEPGAEPIEPVSQVTNDDVVTSFPVRPARVERRVEDTERPRIDAEEAERLRAEMVPDVPPQKDDLRALFADEGTELLDLDALADPINDVDEFDFMDDDYDHENPDLTLVASDEAEMPEAADMEAEAEAAAEEPEAEEAIEASPASGIEVSVSSITALLTEQNEKSGEDYEPEPESSALAPVRVVSIVDDTKDTKVEQVEEPASEVQDTSEQPLSATAMWNEFSAREPLPEDAKGLQSAFAAFLSEYDEIAREYHARTEKGDAPVIPTNGNQGRAEWHVL